MQSSLIKLLLNHGANPEIKNTKLKTPVDLCIDNENLIGIQLLLREINFQSQTQSKNNHFVYYLTNLACRGKDEMKFVYDKLTQVDEKLLKVELKRSDWNGFKFLVYLIKRFTETVHSNFKKKYIEMMQNEEGARRDQPEVQKNAINYAFENYVEHEKILITLINFLV